MQKKKLHLYVNKDVQVTQLHTYNPLFGGLCLKFDSTGIYRNFLNAESAGVCSSILCYEVFTYRSESLICTVSD